MYILPLHKSQIELNFLWTFKTYGPKDSPEELEYIWECDDPRINFFQWGDNGSREVFLSPKIEDTMDMTFELFEKIYKDIAFLNANFFNYR